MRTLSNTLRLVTAAATASEPGRPACADAELQGQVHDALEQIVSCNHNLQQVHFSAVSCNHNLQQVHFSAVSCNHNLQQSSCTSLVQSQPAAGALFCSLMQSQPAAGALFLWWYQHGIHILHLGEVHDLQKSAPAAGLIHIAAFSAPLQPDTPATATLSEPRRVAGADRLPRGGPGQEDPTLFTRWALALIRVKPGK